MGVSQSKGPQKGGVPFGVTFKKKGTLTERHTHQTAISNHKGLGEGQNTYAQPANSNVQSSNGTYVEATRKTLSSSLKKVENKPNSGYGPTAELSM